MSLDRYARIVLTVIALELGWMIVKDVAVPVAAQQAEAMPVIIRGVEVAPGKEVYLPVTIAGTTSALRIASDRPIPIEAPQPIKIEADDPIPVMNGDRPLSVRTVPDPPAPRPGV